MKKILLVLFLVNSVAFSKDIFIDKQNKLMWQDNKDVIKIQKPYVIKDNVFNHDYTNVNGDTAYNYCKNLSLNNYTNWRLPSIKERKELNKIQKNLSFNKRGAYYWSSTYSIKDTLNRYVMVGHDMSIKSPLWERSLPVGYNCYVRCVRKIE